MTVRGGHIHLRNLAEALQDRAVTLDQFVDEFIEAMRAEGIVPWPEAPD